MKNIELKIIIGIALAIFLVVIFKPIDPLGALTVTRNSYGPASITNSSSTITATTTVAVFSLNADRVFAQCTNDGGNTVYCSKKATSTGVTAQTGSAIDAGGTITFDMNDPYVGALFCLTTPIGGSATSSLSCEEK